MSKTSERKLPRGVYTNGEKYMVVIRHETVKRYLGSFSTVAEAAEQAAAFRRDYPVVRNKRWRSGDQL